MLMYARAFLRGQTCRFIQKYVTAVGKWEKEMEMEWRKSVSAHILQCKIRIIVEKALFKMQYICKSADQCPDKATALLINPLI